MSGDFRSPLVAWAQRNGVGDPFTPPYPRMEEFFGDLFYELHTADGGDREEALKAYRALIRLYGRVLASSTNWFHDRPLGCLGRYLRALIDSGASKLTLITFNHDLALENAVVQLPYRRRWCITRGYGGVNLVASRTMRRGSKLPTHDDTCDHSVDIRILKLHGSLNWQVKTLRHDPDFNTLFPTKEATTALQCVTDRVVSTQLMTRAGNRTWRLWPVIVPPIYDKQGLIASRFAGLWGEASEALRDADKITMIGYSMPEADLHAANMIRRGVRANQKVSEVSLVNPDGNVLTRFTSLVGVDAARWFRDLSPYTRSLSQ